MKGFKMEYLKGLVLGSFFSACLMPVAACTPQMRKDIAHTAIDILLASCIAEHPDADEPELKAVCKYTEENAEAVKSLIAARKRGMAKAGAVKCASAPDGGK